MVQVTCLLKLLVDSAEVRLNICLQERLLAHLRVAQQTYACGDTRFSQ